MNLNQAEQEEIARLLQKKKELTPSYIVEAARFKASALNHRFEWDDKSAAVAHRLEIARDILQSFRITVISKSLGERTTDFSITPGVVSSGEGYRDVRLVMGEEDSAARQLAYEWKHLSARLLRFASLCALSPDYEECAKWAHRVRAEGDRRAARLMEEKEVAA